MMLRAFSTWTLVLSTFSSALLPHPLQTSFAAEPATVMIADSDSVASYERFLAMNAGEQKQTLELILSSIEEIQQQINQAEDQKNFSRRISLVAASTAGFSLFWAVIRRMAGPTPRSALLPVAITAVLASVGVNSIRTVILTEKEIKILQAELVELQQHALQVKTQIELFDQLESGAPTTFDQSRLKPLLENSLESQEQAIQALQKAIFRIQNDLAAAIEDSSHYSSRRNYWISGEAAGAFLTVLGILGRKSTLSKASITLGLIGFCVGLGGSVWDSHKIELSESQITLLKKDLDRRYKALSKSLSDAELLRRLSRPE